MSQMVPPVTAVAPRRNRAASLSDDESGEGRPFGSSSIHQTPASAGRSSLDLALHPLQTANDQNIFDKYVKQTTMIKTVCVRLRFHKEGKGTKNENQSKWAETW
ncbi:hypothetical protein WR25_20739 [Diploscapter pachys]|uniref:Uncharacterized protein n=1 Tax=Diploscapter pachys TaxID=2018661 RepID=A0A2A2JUH8_9BILA|nr:hypothetical protein WR25_20739 [Diploscapter pachys]